MNNINPFLVTDGYKGDLQTIFEDGKFYNETTLTEIRNKLR